MTILFGNASWCVQGQTSITPQGLIPTQQPVTPQERDSPSPAPGQSKNEVRELECVILFWSIKMLVNPLATPDPAIEFRLRRNQSNFPVLATIDFEPLETGTKAQLLNIPILVGENFDFQIEQFGSGNTEWSWMFAGKLGGQPPIPPPDIPIVFNVNSTIYNQFQEADLYGAIVGGTGGIVDGEIVMPIQQSSSQGRYVTGLPANDPLIPNGEMFAHTFGFLKKTRFDITLNTMNKDIDVSIARDGVQLGTIFTILAGVTGSFVNTGNTPIEFGHKYSYHFQTTDQLNAVGDMTVAMATDIEWGNV